MDVYSCNKEFYCYCLLLMLQLTVYSKNKIYLITLDTSLKEKFKFFLYILLTQVWEANPPMVNSRAAFIKHSNIMQEFCLPIGLKQ